MHDLSGRRFGRLVAVKRVRTQSGIYKWACRCDCGSNVEVRIDGLTSGRAKSCGCFKRDRVSQTHETHGLSKHPLYKCWVSMWERCTDPENQSYGNYGGRGIKVCDRWADIRNFIADMGPKPKGGSIDRINNNAGYSPDNCRWADRQTQSRNRRTSRIIDVGGREMCVSEAGEKYGVGLSNLCRRLNSGMSVLDAVTKPQQKRYRHVTINGESMTVPEWSKVTGVLESTIYWRLSHGRTPEEAVSTTRLARA